jgi:hypothetical protein
MSPCKNALTVGFANHKLPLISVAINEPFESTAMSFVVRPLTLVDPAIIIDNDTLAIAFSIFELSLVNSIFILLDTKALTCFYNIKVELIAFHLII